MAWRIADYLQRGEIDNREKGRITGQIWLNGIDAPVESPKTGHSVYFDIHQGFIKGRNRHLQKNPLF